MKSMKPAALALAALAAASVSVDAEDDIVHHADDTLQALMRAAPEGCPEGEMLQGAHSTGPSEARGITEELMAATPLSGQFAGHVLRQRRVIIAPGGVVPWHSHDGRQGIGLIVSGEFTEYKHDCRVPIRRGPGSISREAAGLAHYWRNEGDEPVVLIASDVVPE